MPAVRAFIAYSWSTLIAEAEMAACLIHHGRFSTKTCYADMCLSFFLLLIDFGQDFHLVESVLVIHLLKKILIGLLLHQSCQFAFLKD